MQTKFLSLALAAAASFIGAGLSDAATFQASENEALASALAEVPLSEDSNRLYVPVMIEGVGETLFKLDTGASVSVVTERVREHFDLDETALREETIQGATGPISLEVARIPGISVGGLAHDDVWVLVLDTAYFDEHNGQRVDGILGADILSRYDIAIDLPDAALRFFPHGTEASDVGNVDSFVPFYSEWLDSHGSSSFVQFIATVNGEPVPALLDTGARLGTLNWEAAALAGVYQDTEGVYENEEGSTGIGGQVVREHRFTLDGICLADRCYPQKDITIADLPVFEALGNNGPALNVGSHFLADCPVFISYSTHRLFVCPAAD